MLSDSSMAETSSHLRMSQNISLKDVEGSDNRMKIEQLYKFLNVAVDIDRFKVRWNTKTRVAMLYFFKDDGVLVKKNRQVNF